MAIDRGYDDILRWFMERHFDYIHTQKRSKQFIWIWGLKPGSKLGNRIQVPEVGEQAAYWAIKSIKMGSRTVLITALAFRNGTGRVVLLSTTIPEFGLQATGTRGEYMVNWVLARQSKSRLRLQASVFDRPMQPKTTCICGQSAVNSRFFCDICDRKMHKECPCALLVLFNASVRRCFECMGQTTPDFDRTSVIAEEMGTHTYILISI